MMPNSVHSETTKQNPSLEWKKRGTWLWNRKFQCLWSKQKRGKGPSHWWHGIFQNAGRFAEPKLKSKLHNSGISRKMLIYIVLVDLKKHKPTKTGIPPSEKSGKKDAMPCQWIPASFRRINLIRNGTVPMHWIHGGIKPGRCGKSLELKLSEGEMKEHSDYNGSFTCKKGIGPNWPAGPGRLSYPLCNMVGSLAAWFWSFKTHPQCNLDMNLWNSREPTWPRFSKKSTLKLGQGTVRHIHLFQSRPS